MNLDNRFEQDIAFVSRQLSTGQLTSEALTDYAIEQHATRGASLHAYKCWQPSKAQAMARDADQRTSRGMPYQALQGIPISVKDIYGLEGYPIYAGSAHELPDKWQKSGWIVQLLRAQAAVFIGKTHTVEFAFGGLGVNNHWGTPKNPWDLTNHRVPGGSSSGAGVSLHEGSALVALGTDTAGSVRVPASYTGNVGLKTTTGLWSTAGIVPLSPTLDTAGILTRTAADSHFVYTTLQHPGDFESVCARVEDQRHNYRDRNVVIGLDDGTMWNTSATDIVQVCMHAIEALTKDTSCRTASFQFPEAEQAIELRNIGGPVAAELVEFLRSELPEWVDRLDPVIRDRIKIGGDISATEYLRRIRQIHAARQSIKRHFEFVDVIASPTVPLSPSLMSDLSTPEDYMKRNLFTLQNTTVGSFLDLCAITIPVGLDSVQMPVGLQFMAPPGNEQLLLAIAERLENIVRQKQLMPY